MAINAPTIREPYFPARYHWTRAQYERAISSSVFGPDDKVELLYGEITEKMSPQNSPHSAAIGAMQDALEDAFPKGHWVRVQLPLALSDDSEPEPDLAVVRGSWRNYTKAQPTTAMLVVEISDTTLLSDRTAKASVYAQAGIPEYWIFNLPERIIEVHREPSPIGGQPFGFHYQNVSRVAEAQTISPLAAPGFVIRVGDLLP